MLKPKRDVAEPPELVAKKVRARLNALDGEDGDLGRLLRSAERFKRASSCKGTALPRDRYGSRWDFARRDCSRHGVS
jgi:hypothetical protein